MKKGLMIAIAGFLIVLALFGYSYYANKATVPPDKEATINATTTIEKATKNTPTVNNEVEEQAPKNAAEAIEQAKKNGESMWLLFRSTTCAPCVEMQKVFDQLEPDYKGKMRFIAIDVNDRTNVDILKSFKIQYVPTTFIIDGTGNISYQNVGVIPTDDLKKELSKVVK